MRKILFLTILLTFIFAGCSKPENKEDKTYNPNGEIIFESIQVEEIQIETII